MRPRDIRFVRAALTAVLVICSTAGSVTAFADDITVHSGDTLWSLASKYHTTVSALETANAGVHLDPLRIGATLHLPSTNHHVASPSVVVTYRVSAGDTLWSIAMKRHTTVTHLLALNPSLNGGILQQGSTIRVPGTSHALVFQSAGRASSSQVLSGRGIDLATMSTDSANLFWMARVIHAEAHDQPLTSQIAVGDVVWHRMLGNPGATVHDIVFAQSGGQYQFTTAADGEVNNPPSPRSMEAAIDVLVKHEDVVPGAYYFYDNADTASDAWIRQRTVVANFNGFIFAK